MPEAGLVTIGITCFNARDTIGRAIGSALAQDYPRIELIVVDDCSSDESAAIVAGLIAGESRARLVRHERNQGVAGARNSILAHAGGEFVAFFDDDDEAMPERIREQVRTLTGYEESTGEALVVCHASGERLYPSGYRMPLPAIGSRPIVPHGTGMADYLLFYGRRRDWFYGSGIPASSLLARASTFAEVGGFDAGLRRVEDADFAIRLGLRGGHFIGTIMPLFTQYSTDAPDKSPEANRDAEVAVAKKHAAYLRSVGRQYYAENWPRLRYYHFRRRYLEFAWQFMLIALRNPVVATRHLLTTGPKRLTHERKTRDGGVA